MRGGGAEENALHPQGAFFIYINCEIKYNTKLDICLPGPKSGAADQEKKTKEKTYAYLPEPWLYE